MNTTLHLTPPELAARWRRASATLAQWRCQGLGPAFIRAGYRRVLYPIDAVEAFEAAHRIEPVADHRPQRGT
jgi:hypothetical protein